MDDCNFKVTGENQYILVPRYRKQYIKTNQIMGIESWPIPQNIASPGALGHTMEELHMSH